MGIFHWFSQHWLDLLQSAGIVSSFVFTTISLRNDTKVQRVSNLLTITKSHREIWTRLLDKPELRRVLDPSVDLNANPITRDEELFVSFVIFHLSAAQEAIKQGMFSAPDGLRKDIKRFFSWPIPKSVWEQVKALQDTDFVVFVEKSRAEHD